MTPLLPLFLSLVPTAQDHSPLHPAGASFFVQAPDISGLISAYEQSAYAKLLQDPELLAAIGKVIGDEDFQPLGMLEAEIEKAEQSGEIPSVRHLLASLRAVSMSFNLKDNDLMAMVAASRSGTMSNSALMEQKLASDISAQVVIDFADEASASELLGMLMSDISESERKTIVSDEIEGPGGLIKRWRVQDDDQVLASTMELYQDKGRLFWVLGNLDNGTLTKRMAAGGSTVAERMGTLHRGMGVPNGVTLLELHNRMGDQIIDLIEAETGVDGVSNLVLQLAEGMGGPGYSMLARTGAWRVSADGGRFMTQGLHTASSGSELDGAIGAQNLSAESMALVHPEAIAGGVVSLDPDRIAAWAEQMDKQKGGGELANIEEAFGFHPITDLIQPLGGAMAWSLNGNFGLSAPPFQITAQVRDADALRRGIAGLVGMLADEGGDIATVTSKPYRGFEVTTVKFNGEAFDGSGSPVNPADMFQPTFVVLEDRVLMTLNSIQAKREIKRVIKGNAELNPLLVSDAIPEGGAGDIGFANWIEVFGRIYTAGKSFAPLMMGQMEGPAAQMDLTALPSAELFTRHFSTSYNWKRHTEGGVQYYGESSFGLEGSALPLTVLVSAGMASYFTVSDITTVSPQATPPQLVELAGSVPNGVGRAQRGIAVLQAAVEQFQTKNGDRLPASLDMLTQPDITGASFATEASRVDPWGNSYLYWMAEDGSQFAIWSAGPDGVDDSGEGDDVIADL